MINRVGKEAKKTGIRLFSDSGARGSEVHCSHFFNRVFLGGEGEENERVEICGFNELGENHHFQCFTG
jgi:hypothetical protein